MKISNILQEYLVSIGFNVNAQSLNDARHAMGEAESIVNRFAKGAVGKFVIGGAAVATFLASVTLAIGKFMAGLAQSDLKMEMMARRLWTTRDNAEAFDKTLKAMGATMEDLYLSPELMNNFMELRKEAFSFRPPEEYKEQQKELRSIMFEFQRFKLAISYAAQWVSYYLFKYLEEPLKNLKVFMKGFNESFQTAMPKITKVIAQVLSWFVRLGIAGGKAITTITKLFTALPTSLKVATSAFAGFFMLLKMGPIGWIIAGITALLLVLDDFYTYQSGGKSQFADMWKWLDDMKQQMEEDGTIEQFKKTIDDLGEAVLKLWNALVDLGKTLGELLNDIAQDLGFKNFGDMLVNDVMVTVDLVTKSIELLTGAIRTLKAVLEGDWTGASTAIMNTMEDMAGVPEENRTKKEDVDNNVNSMGKTLKDTFSSPEGFFGEIGKEITDLFSADHWKQVWSALTDNKLVNIKSKDNDKDKSGDKPVSKPKDKPKIESKVPSQPSSSYGKNLDKDKLIGSGKIVVDKVSYNRPTESNKSRNKPIVVNVSYNKQNNTNRMFETKQLSSKTIDPNQFNKSKEMQDMFSSEFWKNFVGAMSQLMIMNSNGVSPSEDKKAKMVSRNQEVSQTNNYNIYGTTPQATANTISTKVNVQLRNLGGFI